MRQLFVILLLALPLAAHAQPRFLHSIPWYEAHDAARIATLKRCHSNEASGRLPNCMNAERAEDNKLYSNNHDFLNDPEYWSENRLARAGALAQCAAGHGLLVPYCSAVRKSQAESP